MRLLRVLTILVFLICLGLNIGMTEYQKSKKDTTIPVIKSEQDVIKVSVNATDEELLTGLTATDEKDGDITDNIMVIGTSRFVKKGVAKIRYVVFDSDHNYADYSRKIKYKDYKKPRFELEQPLEYNMNSTVSFLDFIAATDMVDGDLTNLINVEKNNIDVENPGVYYIRLSVANSFGDKSEVELPVLIREKTQYGRIELTDYLVYIAKGEEFHPEAYVDSITANGYSKLSVVDGPSMFVVDQTETYVNNIKVSHDINKDKAGSYQVTYSFNSRPDDKDSEPITAMMTVVVN